MAPSTLAVIAVIFLATTVRSTFGFGEALVAMPLLALFVPVRDAAPLVALVSITVAIPTLVEHWREVHLRSAWRLIVSALAGVPLGLLLLTSGEARTVEAILAAVILVFSTYSLRSAHPPHLASERSAWTFGFGLVSGILGGAYNMNGPPLVVYGTMRRWSPTRFRATLQAYFLPVSSVGLCGYWATGLWTATVTRTYLGCLPGVVSGVLLGRALHRRLAHDAFVRWVHVGLLLIGATLLVEALRGL